MALSLARPVQRRAVARGALCLEHAPSRELERADCTHCRGGYPSGLRESVDAEGFSPPISR